MLGICNRLISWSFYSLFFFVPLIFFGNTSELFEFNKMWLTFGLAIVIASAWGIKMILQKKFSVQRTPLDIPILLFLASQVISTIFSMDNHVSWWGYYSRWNGGLLSTITYIFLYYAFVSNLETKHVLRSLTVSLFSGLIVALWGFPAHFGYDPTCLVFRGTLDTSCWTEAFKPTVRTFSTLGQPAWEAAYMALLLPLAMAYTLKYKWKTENGKWKILAFLSLVVLFYLSLIFTNTRAGVLGFVAADVLLWGLILFKKISPRLATLRNFVIFHVVLFIASFFFGMPHASLSSLTFTELTKKLNTPPAQQQQQKPPAAEKVSDKSDSNVLITDSGEIRKHVWNGAMEAWKNNPIFGTGVETFAFAYYKYKPAEHNLTSEWDYLYNKAHNEYLNYLTTTGAFGLGTYLLFIGFFIFLFIKYIISKSEIRNSKQSQNTNDKSAKRFDHSTFENSNLFRASNFDIRILLIGLFAGWISILVTNFFGFSVVIMNLYLFLIPAFFFILSDMLNPNKAWQFPAHQSKPEGRKDVPHGTSPYQWTGIIIILIIALIWLVDLLTYWSADVDYALGSNLDKVGQYQQGYEPLRKAVNKKQHEPVYLDEQSQNLGVLANAFALQKDTQNAEQLANEAIKLSNAVVDKHPNNVVYWKNRVRLFYTLAQSDLAGKQTYLIEAVTSIDKARALAPRDAKIAYNQGVLHGQIGDFQKGVALLEETIKLKPNYRDAYYALGLYYRQLAIDENEKVVNPEMQKKAVETLEYIINNLPGDDKQVKETLKSWGK